MSLVADAYSDEDMQCPAEWYGGYKAPWLISAGDAERALSDLVGCDPVPATFRFTLADVQGVLREQLTSPLDRYWRDPISFYMTSRANRAVLGTPFNAFTGFIADAQPIFPHGFDITLADIITQGILNGELEVPWRKIGDGFLDQLDAVSESLDRTQAEPIIYGRHTRTTITEPSPVSAWPVVPMYLGIQTVDGTQRHCWLVAGHALSSMTIRVDGVDTPEGSDWLVATQANWLSVFGTPYVDYTSSTYGDQRRYSLIYGTFGNDDPDACAQGEKLLTALVEGIEDVGDGSGTLIADYYQQYKHFAINFVANRADFSYMSGNWLPSPTWNITGETVTVVDEDTFDTASAIAIDRYGSELQGAAAIGFNGSGVQTTQLIAEWNRGGLVGFGQTHQFQMGIVHLHPTQAEKDAAPLFTDAYESRLGTFKTTIGWSQQRTVVDFETDYKPETAVWTTIGLSADVVESQRYNKSPRLKVTFAYLPGLTQCQHIADLLRTILTHPLRVVRIEEPVGPDTATEVDENRLAYRNLGQYIKYLHFDAVGGRTERLGWVVKAGVKGSERASICEALDCEDLIDFDVAGSPSPGGSP